MLHRPKPHLHLKLNLIKENNYIMGVFSNKFVQPAGMKKWGIGLTVVGIITLLAGIFTLAFSKDVVNVTRFWAVLLQNSTFFLLVVNSAMFFICVTTLAMGGWQQSFKRVPEAISTLVPVLGVLTLVVLLCIVFGNHDTIYPWLNEAHVNGDEILKGKSGFLSKTFYVGWSVITILLWSYLGWKMRKLSDESDQPMDAAQAKKYIFKGSIHSSLFIVFFGLTVASTIPWLWLMSIDPHWYSTMYSWYTFISTFVSGISLIALFVIYLKNMGLLPWTNEEHLHDLGKFMFAFSIFWMYLWFSQYMLIWYANIPEETVYFKPRVWGNYRGVFFFNLIINFVSPFLLLMKRGAKRNYTIVTFLAILIIFGHWIDFYQMVMPGTMKNNASLSWFEFGIALGFVGLIIWLTGRALEKKPIVPVHHPLFKESIIHHT
jgi:hypothetical protein